jgi:hypothetical protein
LGKEISFGRLIPFSNRNSFMGWNIRIIDHPGSDLHDCQWKQPMAPMLVRRSCVDFKFYLYPGFQSLVLRLSATLWYSVHTTDLSLTQATALWYMLCIGFLKVFIRLFRCLRWFHVGPAIGQFCDALDRIRLGTIQQGLRHDNTPCKKRCYTGTLCCLSAIVFVGVLAVMFSRSEPKSCIPRTAIKGWFWAMCSYLQCLSSDTPETIRHPIRKSYNSYIRLFSSWDQRQSYKPLWDSFLLLLWYRKRDEAVSSFGCTNPELRKMKVWFTTKWNLSGCENLWGSS